MSVNSTTGRRMVSVEVPPELWDRMRDLAERNMRPLWIELAHAMRRHLDAPPVVVVTTPDLAESPLDLDGVPRPRRNGRPRNDRT